MFDLRMIQNVYEKMNQNIKVIRNLLERPLTLTEKILYSHIYSNNIDEIYERGESYVEFSPDRVAMQDATAQMALLQFMMAGKNKVAVPSTVHCDHLIQAKNNAGLDLKSALDVNGEVYEFLESVSSKYGIGFWKPGAGIIHQVVLENYAFPGGMMIGTDSHTVNAGGLGMVAIGVGGADAVDVMAGMPWGLKFPKLIGIKLDGEMNGWTSAKDIILKVAGILTAKGGTGSIVEYFGSGSDKLSCTGKGTICNMGAEIGATTSIFGYDKNMSKYLRATGRSVVADLADKIQSDLCSDSEVIDNPYRYYDEVIEIDLNSLEPYINGPFTPDKATPISQMKAEAEKYNWPIKVDVGLIGSCTNSSYEDISRAASIADQAVKNEIPIKSKFTITPGSEQVRFTTQRDGFIEIFEELGAEVFANACGPCIGQWARQGAENSEKNSIIHSFNRNFAKRADGNPNTHAFVASPEVVTALAISGDLTFNPLESYLVNKHGKKIKLAPPSGIDLPKNGFDVDDLGYKPPAEDGSDIIIKVDSQSKRLQLLKPFSPWNGQNLMNLKLLIKAKGKCTTDHISMAGPWLRFRGHLDNISDNMLTGAINYFNGKANHVKNQLTNEFGPVPSTQRFYKKHLISSIVVGDENYGEGSSREHAAMEPRHLGVKVILVKSFARIHETNLKKQGMLALTFNKKSDYEKIMEDDTFNLKDLDNFKEGCQITLETIHSDGSIDIIICNHSYNQSQIEWYKSGSALNLISKNI
ncbi:MAG: aconitate hydratase [Candidatus Marinimicrobia bacterium]|nr:aconitate hydratase [Candidatus Neomarinimicrobiota bacterium]